MKNLAKYRKFVVALVGAAVTFCTLMFDSPAWLSTVTLALTSLGVYQVPNKR